MEGQGQFGVQQPLSPPDLSNTKPNDVDQDHNQGNAQNGLSPEFQDVLNQQNGHNGQNQPIPQPTIIQGGGNNNQPPIDSDEPGAEFGLDVSKIAIY